MSTEMILVGIILFSAMIAGGVKIWLVKRKDKESGLSDQDVDYDSKV
tara:strand:+ start:527 stop:667 length:141 start_codon:yes stop_codon:yes gene_type:complete